ncbi:MAG: ECF transporter S component [Oscillospiraceae bacterium]|nr:ECF transporter S component [Oscillospiraceae bacterium]
MSVAAESSRGRSGLQSLTITALFMALTYVFTAFINVRLPIAANGGLIHLGNIPLFIGAILFGKKTGALAGGLGMALFDLLSGWTAWAPFTLVIVGLMGFVVGTLAHKRTTIVRVLIAMAAACAIKISGYYIAEGILYGNWLAPASSIPGNLVQIGLAAVITLPILFPLRKAAKALKLI